MCFYHLNTQGFHRLIGELLQVPGVPVQKCPLLRAGIEQRWFQEADLFIMLTQLRLQKGDGRVLVIIVFYSFIIRQGCRQIKTAIGGMVVIYVYHQAVVHGRFQNVVLRYGLFFFRIHAPYKKGRHFIAQ